jgi:hypothetical protein
MIAFALALLLVGAGLGHPSPSRTVSAAGVTVPLPQPGLGVGAMALMADGTEISLRIEHATTGRISFAVDRRGRNMAASLTPVGSLPPCQDRAFRLTGQHWNRTYHWLFRARSAPAYLPRIRVRDALRRAASNITGARNDCGRRDRVSAEHHYDGTTRLGPNITAAGCDNQGRDGVNVIGFRDLPARMVALTCWWWVVGNPITIEADLAFNKSDFRWRTGLRGCTMEYLVEAVATHEFGHVFGLGHVREQRHPLLTMSTRGHPCDNSPSTLGLGDLRGLEALY